MPISDIGSSCFNSTWNNSFQAIMPSALKLMSGEPESSWPYCSGSSPVNPQMVILNVKIYCYLLCAIFTNTTKYSNKDVDTGSCCILKRNCFYCSIGVVCLNQETPRDFSGQKRPRNRTVAQGKRCTLLFRGLVQTPIFNVANQWILLRIHTCKEP